MDSRLHCPGFALGLGMMAALLLGNIAVRQAGALATIQSRIRGPISSSQMQTVRGTVHPLVARARDQGPLSGSTPIENMALVFRLSASQQADLSNLLQEQQTKGSPMYHQWLKRGEFAARYGVSQQDMAKVEAWLRSRGFTGIAVPPSADRVVFSGTAAQVNAAFQTQLHRYLYRGRQHWANSTNISLPQAIASMAIGIEHLNTFRPEPHIVKRLVHGSRSTAVATTPDYTLTEQNGTQLNLVAPYDSQTIYDVTGLYNSGFTGTGQTIAVVGQTDILTYESDIAHFRSLSGLNASNLPKQTVVQNSGTATVYIGDLEEADIDTEWSGAIAKDASIIYITVGNNQNFSVLDSLKFAIENDVAPVISISYGSCEPSFAGTSWVQTLEQAFEQANAQGQTIIASSGDSGSADCDLGNNGNGQTIPASYGLAVDYPASSQYVTSAGGTSFSGDIGDQSRYWSSGNNKDNGSALGYIPETTWNDTANWSDLQNNGVLSAGGGGASSLFTKPSWQVGAGVPGDGQRDVPDVSLSAEPNHDGYVLCTEEVNSAGTAFTGASTCVYPVGAKQVPYFDANENGYLYGGTSIAAPQWAAIVTLMNQKTGNTEGIGNANPILYGIAGQTPTAFHDITTGNNAVVCKAGSPDCTGNSGGYGVMSCCNAGPGYDEATGLGSPDAAALAAAWPRLVAVNGDFSLQLEPSALSVAPGSTATTAVMLSPSGAGGSSQPGFTGTVALTCSNLPAGITCAFSNASVSLTPGTAQTVTLTISASATAAATATARRLSAPPLGSRSPMGTMAFAGVFGLALLGLGRKRRFFPRQWMAVLLLAGGLMAATALTACGGGSAIGTTGTTGGGPPPPQTFTVTGTSGTTVASTQISLTVT